ncbi:LLM class flavin-dependent oxidoreductase [Marivirga arenosa]|uniref:LLM class flavin-dependent oxidoreductase n=1 Tax=Marivirga arenosa TaxID=3059076 RepID=A0AA51ZXG1_9BACT|nr:LLM class flavin-dependent oxidoreductase [Marivirga sp. BKB1-2]WNB18521.1 LLM class flavin-dependent oxidoreductase [Marivirga sp. BKB1-2]
MKISLLEFGEGLTEENGLVRLKNVFDYAIKADELEFSRFWLAEHNLFNRKSAWGCPISLVPVLASITNRIRIGTGGILLKLHNSFDTVAQFKLWNAIYSNRLDLGLANGGVTKQQLEIANQNNESFDQKFEEVYSFLHEEDEWFKKEIIVPPYKGVPPELWALSGSAFGFHRALKYGTNYVRSIFHENSDLKYEKEAFDNFKDEFFNRHGRKVKTMLAISGSCLKDEKRLRELRKLSDNDEKNHLIGNLEYFREKIPALLEEYGADEILWRDMNRDIKEKMEALELLSEFIPEGTTHLNTIS